MMLFESFVAAFNFTETLNLGTLWLLDSALVLVVGGAYSTLRG